MRGVTWRAAPAKFKRGMCENESLRPKDVKFSVYLWGFGSGWGATNAWCNMESCCLKKFFFFFFDMPTLKALALAFAMPTRHWYDVGAEAGWDEKDVVDRSLGKFWFYSLSFFFEHMLSTDEHCCFHLLCHFFWFSTCPSDTGSNLLHLDFSFSEIGLRSAFHRFIFLLIP